MVQCQSPRRSERLAQLRRDGTIHNLPHDVIRQCLLRVPYKSHSNLKPVCKKRKDIVKPQSLRRSKRLAQLRREGPINDLPDDIIRQCLLRVPYKSHSNLKAVCKKWKDIVSSPAFYKERLTSATSDHLICMIQNFKLPIPGRKCTQSTSRVIVFDPLNRTWAMLRPIPDFTSGVPLFRKCVCVNGKLVLMEGIHPTSRVYVFDFVTAKWRRGADMPTPRTGFACSVSSTTGLIYVAGGEDKKNARFAAAQAYNVEEDKWEILPPMTQEVRHGYGVFLGENFFVFGDGNSAQIYDPKTGVWRRVDDMWRFVQSLRWSSLVASGHLYTFTGRQLMKYDAEDNNWVTETVIPIKFCFSWCTAEWRGHIFSRQQYSIIRQACCLLNPSTHELIEFHVPEKFKGVAIAAATVEI